MKDPAKAPARKVAAAVSLVLVLVAVASLAGNLAGSTCRLCLERPVAALLLLRVDERWTSLF
jgi:hypothetical protein